MRFEDLEKPAHIQMALMEEAVQAQSEAELRNAMKRHMERMKQYKDWVMPDNIKARIKLFEEEAAAALERGKAMGRNLKTLPVPDPLPSYMKGQSPSTIQAMLRNGWKPEDD